MNVHSLLMQGFMSHTDTRLKLPERGLVVVTGPNGSGKSSIVEGVAYAGWGETLRETPPWGEGDGKLEVATDLATITRTATAGGRKKVTWAPPTGVEPTKYENNTKAEEALEQLMGDFDVWRRTHVFSSHDAAHFTLATDGERKRLLEGMLGLHRFDTASDACRADKRTVENEHSAAHAKLEQLKVQLLNDRARAVDAEMVLAEAPAPVDTAALSAQRDKIGQMVLSSTGDVQTARRSVQELERSVSTREAAARELERRLHALGVGDCDKCGQPIPKALTDDLKQSAEQERAEAARLKVTSAEQLELLEGQIQEGQEEADALRTKKAELDAKLQAVAVDTRRRAAAQEACDRARKGVQETEGRIAKGTEIVADLAHRRALLETVDTVLGLKGVRAHVLGRALSGIEQAANAWLARFGLNMSMELKPYTERKTGGASDAINLVVNGAGGGYGYKAASGGQRRRIDVALLLALADVASAAAGTTLGTLFMDEVFDALDEEGVEAIRTVLGELAQERVVVVITHSQALISRLPATMKVTVNAGKVVCI